MKTAAQALMLIVLMNALNAEAVGDPGANVAVNPHFDADLSGWTGSSDSFISWTNTQDHHGAGSAGVGSAIVQSTGAPQFIAQCIQGVQGNFRYHLSSWAKLTCGFEAQLSLFWANGECTVTGAAISSSSSLANTWQLLSVDGQAPSTPDLSAVIVLENPGACHDQTFFDDVLFFQDNIFRDSFDVGR